MKEQNTHYYSEPEENWVELSTDIDKCPGIKPADLGIYCHIITKDKHWKFSADRVAKHFGISKSTVLKSLNNLEKLGLIKRTKKNSGEISMESFSEPLKDKI
jgi:predicted transcriptional regulator